MQQEGMKMDDHADVPPCDWDNWLPGDQALPQGWELV